MNLFTGITVCNQQLQADQLIISKGDKYRSLEIHTGIRGFIYGYKVTTTSMLRCSFKTQNLGHKFQLRL